MLWTVCSNLFLHYALIMMCTFHRVLATNCATLFNVQHPQNRRRYGSKWDRYAFALTVEQVWSAFYTQALLVDCDKMQCFLILDHNCSQADRLQTTMEARNVRLKADHYDEWSHSCDLCTWVTSDEDGNYGKH